MSKQLSVRKILQALYYLQNKAKSKDKNNKVYLLKMIFMADRYHLRHFGITATNDNYCAMKLGPVASATYDILKKKNPRNVNSAEIGYLSDIEEISEYDVLIKPQEQDELSDSFKEALDFALKEFGHYSWGKLSNISHCYPEWKKYETFLAENTVQKFMDIQDFFDDPEDETCIGKKGDPFKDDKEFLALLKEEYIAHAIAVAV